MTSSGAEPVPGRITLDTSAYSHLRRGRTNIIDAVSTAELVFVPTTMLGELEGGFRVGSRYVENRRALDDFLQEPYVEVTDITADVARRYGEVFAALRQAGTPIPVNDIWIAAVALNVGAHLITFDDDFSKIEGLPHTLLAAGG